MADNLIQYIRKVKEFCLMSPWIVRLEEEAYFYKIKEEFSNTDDEMHYLVNVMENLLQDGTWEECNFRKIYIYSFLMDMTGNNKYAIELLQILLKNEWLNPQIEYYLYFQVISKIFLGKIKDNVELKVLLYQLLKKINEKYKKALPWELTKIPQEERDPNLVLVVTDQFLGLGHAPTQSTLARCAAIKRSGKKVLLINTAEMASRSGAIPGFGFITGNYWEKNSILDTVQWQDVTIPFFQCDNNMPNLDVLEYLLKVVKHDLKPYYVIAIGGESIFASMLQEMLPVLAVGMVYSDIEISLVNYQTLGRKLNEQDFCYLQKIGKSKRQIIEHKFTSDLREQKVVFRRNELGIGDEFVIVVVGHRLEQEITDEFWQMIESVFMEEPIMVLLLGQFGKKQEVIEKYPILEKALRCEGTVKEVQAYLELCNLYLNPIRVGGGISCVEAMIKGVPVVTTPKGDVSVSAGESFIVKDYKEMGEVVLRYIRDYEFYKSQSEKAKIRANELIDTDKAFEDVINEFMKLEKLI